MEEEASALALNVNRFIILKTVNSGSRHLPPSVPGSPFCSPQEELAASQPTGSHTRSAGPQGGTRWLRAQQPGLESCRLV